MKMKKPLSALCAAAVLLSSIIGGNALFSSRTIHAEEIIEDGSGDTVQPDEDGSGETDQPTEDDTQETVQLTPPQNVRYEDGFIKWDKVEEAYGYNLRLKIGEEYREFTKYFDYENLNDEAKVELDRLCYENSIDLGEYTVDVRIFDEAYNTSEWSDSITAVYEPTLAAPTNVRLSETQDETVEWDEVEGAYRYNIRVYTDDDDRTLCYSTYEGCDWHWHTLYYWLSNSNYLICIQTMDQDYGVSEWTEPISVSHTAREKLDTPKNVRFDETGENILWDEVEGADYYYLFVNNTSLPDDTGSQRYFTLNGYTQEPFYNNWKDLVSPYSTDELTIYVYAYSNDGKDSDNSEPLTISYTSKLDNTITMPEKVQVKDGYLVWDTVENAKIYWINILVNSKIIDINFPFRTEAEYYNEYSYYIGNQYPAGSYDVDLYVVDENHNYNKKTYSITLDTPQDETIWTPYIYYKGDILLWDYDRFRHDNTYYFWLRIRNAADNSIVRLEPTWSENIYGFTELPNGEYLIDACVYEYSDTLGPWSTPLKLSLHDGSGFDKENETTEEIIPPPEIEETIPEDDRITSITINPAFNMKHKDGEDVELDLSKIKVQAKEIYDEEGLKRVEEALGQKIKPNQQCNLLDLTLLYNGEDFSNGYEGLVQVIIPLPAGHKDKTFSCYRITEDENGKAVKEKIEGEQTEDSYIIYLEHFSEYALIGEGEHTHAFPDDWTYDETNHWKECECGEKSEEAAHTYGSWTVTIEATATEKGSRERSCEICGCKETEVIPELSHAHSFGENWVYDEVNHWKECACGEKTEEAPHTYGNWTITNEATQTEKGSRERICEICGYKETMVIPELSHIHTYSSSWNFNSFNHWKECECGDKSEEVNHTYGNWTTTKEATETEKGTRERSCEICGYKETAAIPELSHTHSFGENWVSDEANHWKECECGEKSEEANHAYGDWTITKEATETQEGARERSCEICGYKQTESIAKLLPAAPSSPEKPDDVINNTDNTEIIENNGDSKTESSDNPNTGIAAIETSAAILSVCGAAIALTVKKRKHK